MSKQFRVLATDVDMEMIDALLRKRDDVDILSDEPTNGGRDLLPLDDLVIPPSSAGKISLFCYLAPRASSLRGTLIERMSSVKVNVDLDRSHVIEFWRPFYDGKLLRPGRLYYQNAYYDAERRVLKDQSFLQMGR